VGEGRGRIRKGTSNHSSASRRGEGMRVEGQSKPLHLGKCFHTVTMLPANRPATKKNTTIIVKNKKMDLRTARRLKSVEVDYEIKDHDLHHRQHRGKKRSSSAAQARKNAAKSAVASSAAGGRGCELNRGRALSHPTIVPPSPTCPKAVAAASPVSDGATRAYVPPLNIRGSILDKRSTGIRSARRRGNRAAPAPYVSLTPRARGPSWEPHPSPPGVDTARFRPPRTPGQAKGPRLSLTLRKGAFRYSQTTNTNTSDTVLLQKPPPPTSSTYKRLLPYKNVRKRSEAWAEHIAKGPCKLHPDL